MNRLFQITVFASFVAASLALASCAQGPGAQAPAAAQPAPAAAAPAQPAAAAPTTQDKPDEEIRDIVRVQLDKVKWTPAEGNTFGVETAVLEGDPKKPGYYLVVNHFPPGVMSRPHFHPDERHCIVIKGTWYTNTGDVFTTKGAVALKPGDYMRHPIGVHHFDGALDDDVYVAIAGTGPGGITTVDGGPIFGRIKKGE
jgi:quercetin dioxygenase-like cupin family protein